MHKIATLNKISRVGLANFSDQYEITDDIDSAEGILVRSQDMQDMVFSDGLLAIARAGAGVNNIPITRCAEEGIAVFNTPGANANAVKELVIAALFMDARKLYEAKKWVNRLDPDEESISKQVEKGKGQFAGHELMGKSICVCGLGAIGALVANACEALGMKVKGYDPAMSIAAAHILSNSIPCMNSLAAAMKGCDYVSVHVPAQESTRGLINEEFISMMKKGSTLVNFSRDMVADEDAVVAALESGKIRRYITDFANNKVFHHPNVSYTPHLGASTEEAEDNCASMAVQSLMEYIENGNIIHSVNLPDCSLGQLTKDARVCIINKNIPAMINKISGTLAELGVNIDNMINKSRGDFAYTMLDVDSDVDEKQLKDALLKVDGIISVRVIK